MNPKLLILCLFFMAKMSVNGQYSFEQKITLLLEVEDNPVLTKRAINTLTEFKVSLNKYSKLKPKKKVSKIYTAVKKEYLRNYRNGSLFPDLFNKNTYNCVTGTALLSIIFSEFDIPHQIVELPRHVYILAYPETEAIGIESTASHNGIYPWMEKNSVQALSFLVRSDQITADEIAIRGAENVLVEEYYENQDLNFENLIGIHFINAALNEIERKNSKRAVELIEKSKAYYISPITEMIEGGIYSELISDTEYKDINLPDYVTAFYNLLEKPSAKNHCESFYRMILEEALFNRNDRVFLDTSRYHAARNIADSVDRDNFLSLSYIEEARWHATKDRHNESLQAGINGQNLNPSNLIFEDIITHELRSYAYDLFEYDYIEIDSILSPIIEQNPTVMKNLEFAEFYIGFYYETASEAFYNSDEKIGLLLKQKCESLLEQALVHHKNLNMTLFQAELYGDMASYYYREKDYDNAEKWILLAMETSDDSEAYKNRYNYMKYRF